MTQLDWTIPAIAFTVSGVLLIWARSKIALLKPNRKPTKRKSEHDDIMLQSTYEKLVSLVEEEKIYLNKNIKVSDLAAELNQNEKSISRAINKHSNRNFNMFINSFRVQHSKELLTGGKLDHYTIEAIAEESGFANKVSFYNAFKSDTGMSPKQYRALKHHN